MKASRARTSWSSKSTPFSQNTMLRALNYCTLTEAGALQFFRDTSHQ